MLVFLRMEEQLMRGRKRCVVFDTETETKYRMMYHQYVWISANGPVPEGYEIHHVDEDKLNNDISNLVCISKEEHAKIHMKKRWTEEKYRLNNVEAARLRWSDPEYKKKISEANKGKGHDEAWRQAVSKSNTGKVRSDEARKNYSNAMKEKWNDPEYRAAMIERRKGSNKGQKRTEEQIQKIKEGRSKHFIVDRATGKKYIGFNAVYKELGRSKDFVLKHPELFDIIPK